ncbi:hypothetical protein DNTS_011803 [Danionella cerebrum]|uniref:Uncharacterized protein n=1 Tax=Danionella cerebrum TaxID=2873325 RepID=A0A553P5F3_9TELE|nr:hypothetical protein DNTS_011803 [Danionella translucida]
MRTTFHPDDSMVITIPLASIRHSNQGNVMPENFTCVFKDTYKVFLRRRPKELGVAQLSIGVFLICIGIIISPQHQRAHLVYTLPSLLIHYYNYSYYRSEIDSYYDSEERMLRGLQVLVSVLIGLELVLALVLIYLESKAVCRAHFNSLPMITIKQDLTVMNIEGDMVKGFGHS